MGYRTPQLAPKRNARIGKAFEHAEHEVLHWIGFYNEQRLHEALGDLPPVEYEGSELQERQHPKAVRHLKRASNGPRGITGCMRAFRTIIDRP